MGNYRSFYEHTFAISFSYAVQICKPNCMQLSRNFFATYKLYYHLDNCSFLTIETQ